MKNGTIKTTLIEKGNHINKPYYLSLRANKVIRFGLFTFSFSPKVYLTKLIEMCIWKYTLQPLRIIK